MKLKLKDICKLINGRHSPKNDITKNWDNSNGKLWLRVGDLKDQTYDSVKKLSDIGVKLIKNHNQFIFKKNSIALAMSGSIGKLGWLMNDFYSSGDILNISNQNEITSRYLYYFLLKNQKKINSLKYGTGQLHISKWQIENFEIDLPDFEKQKQIVEKLDAITNYLQQVIEEKQKIIKIKKFFTEQKISKNKKTCNWTKIKIKDICKLIRGRHRPRNDVANHWDYLNGKSWLRIADLKDQTYEAAKKLSDFGVKLIKNHEKFLFKKYSIVIAILGTVGKVGWLMNDFYTSEAIMNITAKNNSKITNKYLYYFLTQNQKKINSLQRGTSQPRILNSQLENFEIDLPDFEIQKQIVEQLDVLKNFQIILNKEEKIVLKIKKLMLQYKIN